MTQKILVSKCCAGSPERYVIRDKDADGNDIRIGYCSECHQESMFVYEVEYPDELLPEDGPEVK